MIEMQNVASSNVESIGYDSERSELHVKFLNSADTYVYQGVPENLFDGLLNASSKGSFIHQEIRNSFPFYKR